MSARLSDDRLRAIQAALRSGVHLSRATSAELAALLKRQQEPLSWCEGWIEGFAAAALLFTGQRARYEKFRDEYLERRSIPPPD